MMFLLDAAFAIELLALTFGMGLFIWALRNKGEGVGLGKFMGFIVVILSVIALLCTTYYGLLYWAQGKFDDPMNNSSMPMAMPMNQGTMQQMMQQMMPLMMQRMMQHKEKMGKMEPGESMRMKKGGSHPHSPEEGHP